MLQKTLLTNIALLTCIATAAAGGPPAGTNAPLPAMLRVEGGIIEYGGDELSINSFTIAAEAGGAETLSDPACEDPTVGEYLLAAKLPAFTVSRTFEFVQAPPEDACTWNREVLQAEGVDGNVYFAGIGSQVPGEVTFLSGGTDPRETISRIHSNIYSFWGSEYQPAPRSRRCVHRDENHFPEATIRNKSAQVKSRRASDARTKMTLPRGTRVTVLSMHGDWSFIKARGEHPCQPDPEWATFEDTGWLPAAELDFKLQAP